LFDDDNLEASAAVKVGPLVNFERIVAFDLSKVELKEASEVPAGSPLRAA